MAKHNDPKYMLKKGANVKINQTIASKVIGITQPYISYIMNRKMSCKKIVAYCITKYIDENAEIEDFFERVR